MMNREEAVTSIALIVVAAVLFLVGLTGEEMEWAFR